MKKRFRISAAVTALALALSFPCAFAAEGDVAQSEEVKPAMSLLCNLGIFRGYEDGSLHPESNITRMEYAALVMRLIGIGDAFDYEDGMFDDVDAQLWGAGDIAAAQKLGYVQGYGDGCFGPEDSITEVDAVKIIVSALGRDAEATAAGGYPQGYVGVATKLKILKNGASADRLATRGYVADLFALSLDVPIAEREFSTGTSGDTLYITDKTFLSEMNVTAVRGVLRAAYGANITTTDLKRDEILVSDKKYKVKKKVYAEYVGDTVDIYVRDYGRDDEEVLGIYRVYAAANSVTVNAADISDETTFSEFVYSVNGRRQRISLATDIAVCYNGSVLKRTSDYTIDKIHPECGTVKLISLSGGTEYDCIIVESYTTLVVKSATQDGIYDTFGNSVVADFDDDEFSLTVLIDGADGSLDDVRAGDIADVAINTEKDIAKIVVTRDTAQTTVLAYGEKDGRTEYTLGGLGDRCVTYEYEAARAANRREAKELKTGNRYKLYFNAFGEIAYAADPDPDETDADTEAAADLRDEYYGFLIEASLKTSSLNNELTVRLMTNENKFVRFEIKDKAKFGREEGGAYTVSKATGDVIYAALLDDGYVTKQIVKYKLADEQTISELYLEDSATGTEYPSVDYKTGKYRIAYSIIDGKYYYDTHTAVMVTPSLGNDITYLSSGTPESYFSSAKTYQVQLWDIESDGYVNLIVYQPVLSSTKNSVGDTAKRYWLDYLNSPVMLVSDIKHVTASDGIDYAVLEGFESGNKVTRVLSDTLAAKNELRAGMAIQYETNKKELQYAYYSEDDEVVGVYSILLNLNDLNLYDFITYDYQTKTTNYNARITVGCGTVTRYDAPYLHLSCTNFVYNLNGGAAVYKYSQGNRTFTKASVTDITEGKRVFFRVRYSKLREIVIIEE